MKKTLQSTGTPDPIGPYSAGIGYNDLIFTSGQIALDKQGNMVEGGIKEQTKRVLENLKSLLDENGSSLDNSLKTTVFLKNINDFADMNTIYGEYFITSKPARSTVEVCKLPKDALVMIDLVAFKSN
jgi:2-iminobutanoate/2-iminopropanoate deaminase